VGDWGQMEIGKIEKNIPYIPAVKIFIFLDLDEKS
jgi:hypothetical protein